MPQGIPKNGPRRFKELDLGPVLAYRISDAARLLGVGASTIYQMRKKGLITFTKLGGRSLITHKELQRILAEAERGGAVCGGVFDPISPSEEDRPEG